MNSATKLEPPLKIRSQREIVSMSPSFWNHLGVVDNDRSIDLIKITVICESNTQW